MKFIRNIPAWAKNKYLIATGLFLVIMFFLDKNDLFTQSARSRQLKELEESRQYYTDRINAERQELQQLKSNPATVEQYAREKYLMKRDNEDLYIISEKPVKDNN